MDVQSIGENTGIGCGDSQSIGRYLEVGCVLQLIAIVGQNRPGVTCSHTTRTPVRHAKLIYHAMSHRSSGIGVGVATHDATGTMRAS